MPTRLILLLLLTIALLGVTLTHSWEHPSHRFAGEWCGALGYCNFSLVQNLPGNIQTPSILDTHHLNIVPLFPSTAKEGYAYCILAHFSRTFIHVLDVDSDNQVEVLFSYMDILYCYDLQTKSLIWKSELGTSPLFCYPSAVYSEHTLLGPVIAMPTNNDSILLISGRDGSIFQTVSLPNNSELSLEPVLLLRDRLIFRTNCSCVCFDLVTSGIAWEIPCARPWLFLPSLCALNESLVCIINSTQLLLVNTASGAIVRAFNLTPSNFHHPHVWVSDIDSDSKPEVCVFGELEPEEYTLKEMFKLVWVDDDLATLHRSTNISLNANLYVTTAVDLNKDGCPEVIASGSGLYCFNPSGNVLWQIGSEEDLLPFTFAVNDIDGDGFFEVLAAVSRIDEHDHYFSVYLYCFNYSGLEWSLPVLWTDWCIYPVIPIPCDLDGDSASEVAVFALDTLIVVDQAATPNLRPFCRYSASLLSSLAIISTKLLLIVFIIGLGASLALTLYIPADVKIRLGREVGLLATWQQALPLSSHTLFIPTALAGFVTVFPLAATLLFESFSLEVPDTALWLPLFATCALTGCATLLVLLLAIPRKHTRIALVYLAGLQRAPFIVCWSLTMFQLALHGVLTPAMAFNMLVFFGLPVSALLELLTFVVLYGWRKQVLLLAETRSASGTQSSL